MPENKTAYSLIQKLRGIVSPKEKETPRNNTASAGSEPKKEEKKYTLADLYKFIDDWVENKKPQKPQ